MEVNRTLCEEGEKLYPHSIMALNYFEYPDKIYHHPETIWMCVYIVYVLRE